MKDLPSPRVRTNWRLFTQMQLLIDGGMTRHGAAVKVANEHWRVVSESNGIAWRLWSESRINHLSRLDRAIKHAYLPPYFIYGKII